MQQALGGLSQGPVKPELGSVGVGDGPVVVDVRLGQRLNGGNGLLWPDFTKIPNEEHASIRYVVLRPEMVTDVAFAGMVSAGSS